MTGLLAILIVVNAIIVCCNENPHRKRRKAAEKAALEAEMNLTPLHADNTLLKKMGSNNSSPRSSQGSVMNQQQHTYTDRKNGWASDEYDMDATQPGPKHPLLKSTSSIGEEGTNPCNGYASSSRGQRAGDLAERGYAGDADESRLGLVGNAARPGVGKFRTG